MTVASAGGATFSASPFAKAPGTLSELHSVFRNPPVEYRMSPLFKVADFIDEAELRWQIKNLKDAGFGGIFAYIARFNNGAPEPILSDWWWQIVDWLASACADEGLQFWVYDDEDWPSGSVGGQLVDKHPEHGWKYLSPTEHHFTGPADIEIPVGSDMFVGAICARREGSRIQKETIADISGAVSADVLRHQLPGGDWTVIIYSAPQGKGFFLETLADLMDKDACAEFIDEVYRSHHERVSKVSGGKLVGFFTDEPCLSMATMQWGDRFNWYPSMPFTPGLPEAFRRRHGYDWLPMLPHLYSDLGPESLSFRCHHWDTCCELYAENYFGQIYDFCEERGLLSSGHLMREEEFENLLTLQGGNSLRLYRRMHVPGVDWIHPIESYPHLTSVTFKCATSMAHLMQRRRTWCESFAGAGWGLSLREMQQIVNWEHVNGINMQIPITYRYSIRKPEQCGFFPPGLSYQQPYWHHIRAFADYEARLCALTSGGGHVAQIALLYPSVDLWSHCWELDLLKERGKEYNSLADHLRREGFDYDILDDETICDVCEIGDDGTLRTSSESFAVLIIPRTDAVSLRTIEQAARFARLGGTVVFVGALARHSFENGADDPKLRERLAGMFGDAFETANAGRECQQSHASGIVLFSPAYEAVIAQLRVLVTPDLLLPGEVRGLCGFRRRLDGGNLYLLYNDSGEKRDYSFTLSAAGQPERWDPHFGEITAVDDFSITERGTSIRLLFHPYEMIPLILRESVRRSAMPARPREIIEIPLTGPFAFRVEETRLRPHISWNFELESLGWEGRDEKSPRPTTIPLGDWCEHGLRWFSGLGHYETTVTIPSLSDRDSATLDLGCVRNTAEVFVNGESAGIVVFEPYVVNVTRLLRPGTNHVRISVANTLSNYFSQFPQFDDKPLSRGGDFPERRVSGLLGPVTLRISSPRL